jgi:sec-independent protein translocase protein TatC
MFARKKEHRQANVDMSVLDHLDELRKRIIIIAVVIFAATLISFFFVNNILDILIKPAKELELIYTTPAEAFMSQIRLSFIAGALLTLPLTLYQVMAFIMPGLRDAEKKVVAPLIIAMILLFFLGMLFGYYFVFPIILKFFLGFATEQLMPFFTISAYISFTVSFLVGFGGAFQLPIVFWFLGYFGILSSKFLRKNRKYAILVIFILAAILTPPDVFSQILMAIPLLALYEVGTILVQLTERRRAKLEKVEEL